MFGRTRKLFVGTALALAMAGATWGFVEGSAKHQQRVASVVWGSLAVADAGVVWGSRAVAGATEGYGIGGKSVSVARSGYALGG